MPVGAKLLLELGHDPVGFLPKCRGVIFISEKC